MNRDEERGSRLLHKSVTGAAAVVGVFDVAGFPIFANVRAVTANSAVPGFPVVANTVAGVPSFAQVSAVAGVPTVVVVPTGVGIPSVPDVATVAGVPMLVTFMLLLTSPIWWLLCSCYRFPVVVKHIKLSDYFYRFVLSACRISDRN